MKNRITKITFNWCQTGNLKEGIGEDFSVARVGQDFCFDTVKDENGKQKGIFKKVVEITPYCDKAYKEIAYQIEFEDGSIIDIYNPNMVYYEPYTSE